MDGSLPGSSVHGIFQARVLEWIAISFSRGSSQPRDKTRVSHIVDRRLTVWATDRFSYIGNLGKRRYGTYLLPRTPPKINLWGKCNCYFLLQNYLGNRKPHCLHFSLWTLPWPLSLLQKAKNTIEVGRVTTVPVCPGLSFTSEIPISGKLEWLTTTQGTDLRGSANLSDFLTLILFWNLLHPSYSKLFLSEVNNIPDLNSWWISCQIETAYLYFERWEGLLQKTLHTIWLLKVVIYHRSILHILCWTYFDGLLRWFGGKASSCHCRRHWFDPCIGKIPCRRKWLSTPVFLPGKFHGPRNLAGFSPWDLRELDVT